jgi:plasmid stabilization system protein ParE
VTIALKILPPARIEYEDAVAWYEAQAPGLGQRFRREVLHGLRRIRDFPQAWHPMASGIRRYRLARFPYGIIFAQHDQHILVLAISHLHRHPTHWRTRL